MDRWHVKMIFIVCWFYQGVFFSLSCAILLQLAADALGAGPLKGGSGFQHHLHVNHLLFVSGDHFHHSFIHSSSSAACS